MQEDVIEGTALTRALGWSLAGRRVLKRAGCDKESKPALQVLRLPVSPGALFHTCPHSDDAICHEVIVLKAWAENLFPL